MPRPTDKPSLVALSEANYSQLFELIGSLGERAQHGTFPFEDRDKNVRDVLTHLHHWHLMFLDWYTVGMNGEKPDMPAKGYTWKTLPALNQTIWARYQQTPYSEAVSLFKQSHAQVTRIIEQHSNDELFTKKHYHWTGSTSLGAYLISATSSHYDWAMKKIRKYKKTIKE